MITKRIARSITGNRQNFEGEFYKNVTFIGKTIKMKGFFMKRTYNLFGIDWIRLFDFLKQPINSYCFSVSGNSKWKIKLYNDKNSRNCISEGLGRCIRAKATFKPKDNVTPIFRPKRKCLFASEASISVGLFLKKWVKQNELQWEDRLYRLCEKEK